MMVLGINGALGGGYQDAAAVLMLDGVLIGAMEEERLNRIKFSPGKLPIQAIQYLLQNHAIAIDAIDVVAFHGYTWHEKIIFQLEEIFMSHWGYCPPIVRFHHHEAHAASTWYASGYEDALVITMDGSGDGISTRIYRGNTEGLKALQEYKRPQSLGIFYSAFTQLCGFEKDSDEYKLMALAAYGNPGAYDLNPILSFAEGSYFLDVDFLKGYAQGQASPDKQELVYSKKLSSYLKVNRRAYGEALHDTYKNLAAVAQQQLEATVVSMVKYWIKKTGCRKLCLAGGVALNGVMLQKIIAEDIVAALYVPPVAADMGIALGNAYLASALHGIKSLPLTHAFWGNEYADDSIMEILKLCAVPYTFCEDIVAAGAALLIQNKTVAWFQGRMEYGPRALGNRSILALPFAKEMKSNLNQKIKFRADFRPFGVSVLEEDLSLYFEGTETVAPFMNRVYKVRKNMHGIMPSALHINATCRVQTVSQSDNALFYNLLLQIKKQSGYGILLNTSFNIAEEPIVCTPREAIAAFFGSGLDVLIIGSFVLTK